MPFCIDAFYFFIKKEKRQGASHPVFTLGCLNDSPECDIMYVHSLGLFAFVLVRTYARSCLFCSPALSSLTSALPARTCFPSENTAFLRIVTEPFQVPIAPDHRMTCIHKNGLVPFMFAVLAHPVAVQYLHIGVPARCTLLCNALDALSGRYLVHTHMFGPSSALISRFAPAASPYFYACDDDPLFCLKAQGPCPVKP